MAQQFLFLLIANTHTHNRNRDRLFFLTASTHLMIHLLVELWLEILLEGYYFPLNNLPSSDQYYRCVQHNQHDEYTQMLTHELLCYNSKHTGAHLSHTYPFHDQVGTIEKYTKQNLNYLNKQPRHRELLLIIYSGSMEDIHLDKLFDIPQLDIPVANHRRTKDFRSHYKWFFCSFLPRNSILILSRLCQA